MVLRFTPAMKRAKGEEFCAIGVMSGGLCSTFVINGLMVAFEFTAQIYAEHAYMRVDSQATGEGITFY